MRLAIYIFLAVVGLGVVTAGGLAYTGHLALPWNRHGVVSDVPPPGEVAVPLSTRPIAANTLVTRDDFLDPATGRPHVIFYPAGRLPTPSTIVDPHALVGRVVRHDKPVGYAFDERDFYPAGTLPGAAAAVPPGKRAVTLDATTIAGVGNLAAGDHVDVVSTRAVDLSKLRAATPLLPGQSPPTDPKVADVRVLAQDATVITPVVIREVPYMSSGSLTSAGQVRTKPTQEITIAAKPDEVASIMQAVGVDATLACMLRSSQPIKADADQGRYSIDDPAADRAGRFVAVDQIVGGKHVVRYVPTAKAIAAGSPAPAAAEGSP